MVTELRRESYENLSKEQTLISWENEIKFESQRMILIKTYCYFKIVFSIVFLCGVSTSLAQEFHSTDDPTVILEVSRHIGEGLALGKNQDFERAIEAYTKALAYPKNSLTYALLLTRGASYMKLQKYGEALKDGAKAITLEPLNALGHKHQAYVYWEMKQMEKVVQYMTTAINLGLEEGMDYYIRGNAYADIGEHEKGIEDLTKAIKAGLRIPEAYQDRGYIYETLGMYEKAEQDFSESLVVAPENTVGLMRRGQVLRCLGKKQKAIDDYDAILDKTPMDIDARIQRMSTFLEIENYGAALKDVEFARENDLDHPYLALVSGNVFHRLGDLPKALEVNRHTNESEVKDVRVAGHFQRGLFLLKRKQLSDAKEEYQEGIRLAKAYKIPWRLEEAIEILSETDFKPTEVVQIKVTLLEVLKGEKTLNEVGTKTISLGCKKPKE